MSSNKLKTFEDPAIVDPFFEYISGSEKGATYDLLSDSISIGRNDDNDLVVNSDSISRNHAFVKRSSNGSYYIQDNKSKNGVFVNGEPVKRSTLKNGDIVQIGELVMRFRGLADGTGQGSPVDSLMNRMPELGKSKLPQVNKRVFIYGAVGIFLALFLYLDGSEEPSKTASSSESEDKIEGGKSIEMIGSKEPNLTAGGSPAGIRGLDDPSLTSAENQLKDKDFNNAGLIESEQYFRKGQREYFNKNFTRSIQYFQTSLSFNNRHVLSQRYLQLSIFEAEKSSKEHWKTGRRYFDSLQYNRSIYHFNQVISLLEGLPRTRSLAEDDVQEVRDSMIKKSKDYVRIGRQKLKAAELFP